MRYALVLVTVLAAASAAWAHAGEPAPTYELTDSRVAARFAVEQHGMQVVGVRNVATGAELRPGEAFSLKLADSRMLKATPHNLRRYERPAPKPKGL